jgi:serine/threonine protein kinase/Tol biopolymer transport system component
VNDSAILASAIADRYVIDREIGCGGMATVYLARDVKHDRLVALKVLNPDLGAVLGGDRFLSEIRVTANLQHPNLLPLFDSGAAAGQLFYVMPYIDGESLRHRLDREKQLPVEEALHIALAVANALDYAHSHGVVHRDLKPENILLQHGEPLVADFGIALAVSNAGGARVTQTGISLGTPQYMSPEQATGDRIIDGRSDIYSLGAVLYEMLGGEPPHSGTTGQAIIAKLMTEDPRPLTALRRSVPPHVDAAVHRALEKLPADRWTTAREFAEALRGERPTSVIARGRREPTSRIISAVAIVATLVAATEGVVLLRRAPVSSEPLTIRFPFVTADSERFAPNTPAIPFSISSDDRRVAYIGAGPNGGRIYVKNLDDMQTRALPTAERPLQPTFSPDGKWLAAVVQDRIVKMPSEGGPLTTVLALNGKGNSGLNWEHPDTIIASVGGLLEAVPADGGTPVVLSHPDTAHGESQQWGPHVVTDRFVAYIAVGTAGMSSNRLGILDRRTGRTHVPSLNATTVLGAVDDRVLWVTTTGNVMAARIDKNGDLGPPKLVLEDVLVRTGGAAKAALSKNGSLLYQRGLSLSVPVLVDEHGVATPVGLEPQAFAHPKFSPDGTHIVVRAARTGGSSLWLIDARTKAMTKLTNGVGIDDQPEWTPDGKRVLYRSIEPIGTTLKSVPIDGSEAPTVLVSSNDPYHGSLSHDGKWIIVRTGDLAVPDRQIFVTPTSGDRTPRLLVNGPGTHFSPALSPDDRVLAYVSDASGRPELYVQPFPGPGERVLASPTAALEPVWSRDGRTLFYRFGRALMALSVSSSPITVSAPRPVFEGNYLTDGAFDNYDIAPDGKHFLMLQSVDRQAETIMVYRWGDELRKAWR